MNQRPPPVRCRCIYGHCESCGEHHPKHTAGCPKAAELPEPCPHCRWYPPMHAPSCPERGKESPWRWTSLMPGSPPPRPSGAPFALDATILPGGAPAQPYHLRLVTYREGERVAADAPLETYEDLAAAARGVGRHIPRSALLRMCVATAKNPAVMEFWLP